MIKVRVSLPSLAQHETLLRQSIDRGLDRIAGETVREFDRETADWKHAVSWQIDAVPNRRAVTTDDAVFIYQDQGTRPHQIRPRRTRWLRFESGGETVFAKKVNHPGTRAKHMVQQVANRMQPRLATLMEAP